MPGPRPLHYRPLIFHPVGEGFIPPGPFAPPPASAGRRGRRPLQRPVRLHPSRAAFGQRHPPGRPVGIPQSAHADSPSGPGPSVAPRHLPAQRGVTPLREEPFARAKPAEKPPLTGEVVERSDDRRGSAARRRSLTSRIICQIYRIKFVRLSFSATGAAMPAALPASMHLSIHAMLRPRLRMICRPSSSERTSSALPPWTIGQ